MSRERHYRDVRDSSGPAEKGKGDRKGEGKGKSSGAYYGSQTKSGADGRFV